MLTIEKKAIRPVIYGWAYDYWKLSRTSDWWHEDIEMGQDVLDWETRLSHKEKNVIATILKGFAQTETEVSNYWSQLIPIWFPVSEIQQMATEFGAKENLHAQAYIYLNDILGLDDFEGFIKEESIAERLESLMSITDTSSFFDATIIDKARSIAIFSAACEGVQLFSAFSILLSFRNRNNYNRLTGVAQQMEWSVQDENMHSVAGCKLFRTLCEENEGLKNKVEKDVVQGMKLAVKLEENYLDKIFELGDIPTISKEEVKAFLYDRANLKFKELGYNYDLYEDINQTLLKEMSWFKKVISSNKDNDFFASHSSSYSKARGDWDF